jgi:hypothetical protein
MHACFKLILFVFSSFILNKRVTYTKLGYLKLTLRELLCLIIREISQFTRQEQQSNIIFHAKSMCALSKGQTCIDIERYPTNLNLSWKILFFLYVYY